MTNSMSLPPLLILGNQNFGQRHYVIYSVVAISSRVFVEYRFRSHRRTSATRTLCFGRLPAIPFYHLESSRLGIMAKLVM